MNATKLIILTLLFLVWIILTMILTASIVGMLLFISDSYSKKSTWMEIGIDLKNKLIDFDTNGTN